MPYTLNVNTTSIEEVEHLDKFLGISFGLRVFLIMFNFSSVAIGLIGNIIVLYGSLAYRAIHMDKVSVLFVETIAATDIFIILTMYIPMLITVWGNGWVMGETLCYLTGIWRYAPPINEVLIIMTASLFKLRHIRSFWEPRKRDAKIIIIGIAIISILSVLIFFAQNIEVRFDPYYLQCSPSLKLSFNFDFGMMCMLYIVLPMGIIVFANTYILYIVAQNSKYTGGRALPSRKSIVTIMLICWVFIFSYLPVGTLIGWSTPGSHAPTWLSVLAEYTLSLNLVANPFIYTFTNKRFKRYMKRLFGLKTHLNSPLGFSHSESRNTSTVVRDRGMSRCQEQTIQGIKEEIGYKFDGVRPSLDSGHYSASLKVDEVAEVDSYVAEESLLVKDDALSQT